MATLLDLLAVATRIATGISFVVLVVTRPWARLFTGTALLAFGVVIGSVGLVAHEDPRGWWVAAAGAGCLLLGAALIAWGRRSEAGQGVDGAPGSAP